MPTAAAPPVSKQLDRYLAVRDFTELLCEPLSPEDCTVQSMPDVSPTRWHLAHTTWFFETFVLAKQPDYRIYNDAFGFLFNSYYNTVGEQFPRPQRGHLSRPTLGEIFAYRQYINDCMQELLATTGDGPNPQLAHVIETGIQHEQQHQELILTDIKHVLSCNPLFPTYQQNSLCTSAAPQCDTCTELDEGIYAIGHQGDSFAYDNESPRHRVFLETFQLNHQLVTCGDFLQFIEDGGYDRPELWLSAGWNCRNEHNWQAPAYWIRRDRTWWEFTLAGLVPIDSNRPVCHVSYFEADAFARWAGARLPTEAEWELATGLATSQGNFADTLLSSRKAIHPILLAADEDAPAQMLGDVWEWTASQYTAYPGYTPPDGALGEYNGKFMCNQFVLRGGSCATSKSHIRNTYRNFFPPDARWQFSGIRLAR